MAIFDHAHPKILQSTFRFPESNFLSSVHFCVQWLDWLHPFLIVPILKIFDQLLLFVIMDQDEKNQFMPSTHSSDKVKVRVPSPDCPHPFLTMLTTKILNQLSICVKLYQQAKNQFHQFFLEIQSILELRDQIGQTHFWPCPTNKVSINFEICMKMQKMRLFCQFSPEKCLI